ncbi:MAG: glycoside hydrolase family 16 protein [Bacteroidota bacterium]
MKNLKSILFILVLGFALACQPDKVLDPGPCDFPAELESYTMVWSEEFEAPEIDLNTWTFEIGDGCDRNICGWGNNELEYYTDRDDNAFIREGSLVIQAKEERFQGYDYTSARMVTKNKADFRYGRIDIRAKLPKGQGIWPAIWMLSTDDSFGGWPRSGEIDIMELIGNKPNEVLGTVHYGHDFWRYKSAYYQLEQGDFSLDYHTFSLLWREDCLRFMVDDQLYGDPISPSTTLPTGYPFNEKFHMILNIAVGGNLPGNPDGSTVFPQEMEVDYIRVYQEN